MLLPAHALRIRTAPVAAGMIILVVSVILDLTLPARGGLLGLAALLIVVGLLGAFMLRVPERRHQAVAMSCAAVATTGRYDPGNHITPPWIDGQPPRHHP